MNMINDTLMRVDIYGENNAVATGYFTFKTLKEAKEMKRLFNEIGSSLVEHDWFQAHFKATVTEEIIKTNKKIKCTILGRVLIDSKFPLLVLMRSAKEREKEQ